MVLCLSALATEQQDDQQHFRSAASTTSKMMLSLAEARDIAALCMTPLVVAGLPVIIPMIIQISQARAWVRAYAPGFGQGFGLGVIQGFAQGFPSAGTSGDDAKPVSWPGWDFHNAISFRHGISSQSLSVNVPRMHPLPTPFGVLRTPYF
jgi:hypothetical protein